MSVLPRECFQPENLPAFELRRQKGLSLNRNLIYLDRFPMSTLSPTPNNSPHDAPPYLDTPQSHSLQKAKRDRWYNLAACYSVRETQ